MLSTSNGDDLAAVVSTAGEPRALGRAGETVLRLAALTDVGLVREHNEDCMLVADLTARSRVRLGASLPLAVGPRGVLLVVCDGMGGAAAGEVASHVGAEVVYEVLAGGAEVRDRERFARSLVESVQEAGARIFLMAKCNPAQRGMGTTATVAGVLGRTLFVGQVGDSRAYVLRSGRLQLMTRDQSLVFKMVEAGRLSAAEAEDHEHSNIILQALGTSDAATVDLSAVDLCAGDVVMLCSDGLSGFVTAERIREVLATVDDPAACCQRLVQDALGAGGHDNITLLVARVEGDVPPPGADDADGSYEPYVLLEGPEPFPGVSAVKSIKPPNLPPPGSSVKIARSFPPAADEAPWAVPATGARGATVVVSAVAPTHRNGRAAIAWWAVGLLLTGIALVGWWRSRAHPEPSPRDAHPPAGPSVTASPRAP